MRAAAPIGQPGVAAQRVNHHRQRLKRHHAEHAAQEERQADLGDPQAEERRQNLMEDGPELDVINEKWIRGGILDEAGDDLAGFDRHLPVREADQSDTEAQEPLASDPGAPRFERTAGLEGESVGAYFAMADDKGTRSVSWR